MRRRRAFAGAATVVLVAMLAALPVVAFSVARPTAAAPTTAGSPVGRAGALSPVPATAAVPPWAPTHLLAGVHPAVGGGVDPFAVYSTMKEPAPVGITDYGVDASQTPYTYSTPEWYATANISRLLAYTPTKTAGDGTVSFQLNVVDEIVSPSHTTYAYWIQDVAVVDTIASAIEFEDNVWNLSSSSGALAASALSGNGTVYDCPASTCGVDIQWYADQPSCDQTLFPGNCVYLTYPGIVAMRVTTGLWNGLPHVLFQWDSQQSGWVSYDNVTFPWAHGFQDSGFTVDGTQYTPRGNFFDAEWDYAGPPASRNVDRNSSLDMQLEYWNGHNLEAPSNAYGFGSDTGEQISGVSEQAAISTQNGSVGVNLTTGSGDLAMLYTSGDVGVLNASSSLSAGTLMVGGEPHPFVGRDALLRLGPGSYPLVLWNGSTPYAWANVTITAGQTTDVSMVPVPRYDISVRSEGLPTAVSATVTVRGVLYSVPAELALPGLPNGTYDYSVTPIAGYTTSPYQGTFTVSGATTQITIVWTPFRLPVQFESTGLPSGTSWSVDLAGTTLSSANPSGLTTLEPNGTYAFSVSVPITYLASPEIGVLNVTGRDAVQLISFSLRPGYIAGLITPENASVWVDGEGILLASGVLNVTVLPGNHSVEVAMAGFVPWFENVSVAPGATTPLEVTLESVGPSSKGSTSTHPTASSGTGGLSLLTAALIVGVVAAAALALVAVAATRRPRRPAPPRRTPVKRTAP